MSLVCFELAHSENETVSYHSANIICLRVHRMNEFGYKMKINRKFLSLYGPSFVYWMVKTLCFGKHIIYHREHLAMDLLTIIIIHTMPHRRLYGRVYVRSYTNMCMNRKHLIVVENTSFVLKFLAFVAFQLFQNAYQHTLCLSTLCRFVLAMQLLNSFL